ncbi:Fe2+-enterobactin ABC transporter substrate-binding protein [Pectobacteriaceae bacterium C52]|uniref:Fe2+-enterobactin ABC transporter substrate-binding protein n=1 Tax=Brenneria uluponensis TaxID=3057057 RepID=UPI0028E3DBD7|nr:Fe2+-enterobactin ABC transporter substrate-binding protein [Brenneria ulupoensis]WJV61186.1 Fe2+-enterobactin ABC transporter substrate-binding protein [Pectobacteriaceae bacterium C52]WJY09533.1 Fe2+-enterobactin ABC transporter substrate-binding protein [Pectobacteriaceae bacterium C80]
MQRKVPTTIHWIQAIIVSILASVLLSGCDDKEALPPPPPHATAQMHQVGWPRTIETLKGPLTLQHPPQRIVSTSVTISGTLLAINAPLIASGATSPNTAVSDSQGFFTQWSKEATARGVKPLYITEPNAEAIAAAAPDLIVIAATGGDSALKLYKQLSAIAPTLVIDYGNKSWQQLAQQLGEATGHDADALRIITRFEQRVQTVKRMITLPPQPVSALVYYEDGRGINLWTAASAQGQLLTELGFTLSTLPAGIKTETKQGKRQDIVQISGENTADSLNGKSLLLFAADDSTVSKLNANPFLNHLESVAQHRVWAMGLDTFRLDYYSASDMLNHIEQHFKKP